MHQQLLIHSCEARLQHDPGNDNCTYPKSYLIDLFTDTAWKETNSQAGAGHEYPWEVWEWPSLKPIVHADNSRKRRKSVVRGPLSDSLVSVQYHNRPCIANTIKYILCLNLYKIHWYNNIGKKSYFWPLVVIKYILNMNNISLGKTAPLLLVMGSHSQNPKTTKMKCLEQLLMMWEFRKEGFPRKW